MASNLPVTIESTLWPTTNTLNKWPDRKELGLKWPDSWVVTFEQVETHSKPRMLFWLQKLLILIKKKLISVPNSRKKMFSWFETKKKYTFIFWSYLVISWLLISTLLISQQANEWLFLITRNGLITYCNDWSAKIIEWIIS